MQRNAKRITGENSIGEDLACLDSSTIIELLKGNEAVVGLLEEYQRGESISTTVINEYELTRHQDKTKVDAVNRVLNNINVHSFTRLAAQKAAQIYKDLRDKGKMINENDILIAAIAMVNDETLITGDKKFGHVQGIKLKII